MNTKALLKTILLSAIILLLGGGFAYLLEVVGGIWVFVGVWGLMCLALLSGVVYKIYQMFADDSHNL